MLNQQTIEKLHGMKMHGMADAFRAQLETTQNGQLSFEERFALLVDQQWLWKENRPLARRLQNASRVATYSRDKCVSAPGVCIPFRSSNIDEDPRWSCPVIEATSTDSSSYRKPTSLSTCYRLIKSPGVKAQTSPLISSFAYREIQLRSISQRKSSRRHAYALVKTERRDPFRL